jgi:hypothetical protein
MTKTTNLLALLLAGAAMPAHAEEAAIDAAAATRPTATKSS